MVKAVHKASSQEKKSKKPVDFLHKSACATCRKARRFMEKHGYLLRFRDLARERLTVSELEKLIGRRDHEDFLNPRSGLFRRKHMEDNPPSRREAIGLMARDPDLIRRPVIVAGGRVVIGYDENGMMRF